MVRDEELGVDLRARTVGSPGPERRVVTSKPSKRTSGLRWLDCGPYANPAPAGSNCSCPLRAVASWADVPVLGDRQCGLLMSGRRLFDPRSLRPSTWRRPRLRGPAADFPEDRNRPFACPTGGVIWNRALQGGMIPTRRLRMQREVPFRRTRHSALEHGIGRLWRSGSSGMPWTCICVCWKLRGSRRSVEMTSRLAQGATR